MRVSLFPQANKPKLKIEDLVELYYDSVLRFCAVRLGQEEGADATQETFVIAQKQIGTFRGDAHPKTWLLGISQNVCRARNRKLGREHPMEYLAETPAQAGPDLIDRVALERALNQLSPEHREVVVLHEIDELKYAEISHILGIPEGTVKSRLHHAFCHLRKQLVTQEGY